LIERDERIHKDPAPFIGLTEMADSSVNLVVRVWADTPNYWPIYFDMMEEVKKTFDAEGISIPFPQRDVHLYNQKA
jgi:small conductance mechanosensitive channel